MKRDFSQPIILILMLCGAFSMATPCMAQVAIQGQADELKVANDHIDNVARQETKQYFDNEMASKNKQFNDEWSRVNQITTTVEPYYENKAAQETLQKIRDQVMADEYRQDRSRDAVIQQTASNLKALANEPANAPGVHLDADSSNLYVRNYR